MSKKQHIFSFEKVLLYFMAFLFILILVLSFLAFSPINFLPVPPEKKKISSYSENQLVNKTLISSSQIFTNNSKSQWIAADLPDSRVKVLSAININTTLSVSFMKDAPSNSSSGIIFYNDLPEKDPNVRKLSFYYLLKNKQWILKYQLGKQQKFFGFWNTEPENASGKFSFLISSDGKRVLITLPNKKTKHITLPGTLYDISNQMSIKPLLGPKSQVTFTHLAYESVKL